MLNEERLEGHIRDLILMEFAGMLTSAEQKELDILISEDERVKALRTEIRIKLSDPELALRIENLKHFSLSDVKELQKKLQKKRLRKVYVGVTAIAALIIPAIGIYIILNKEPVTTVAPVVKSVTQLAGSKNVQLKIDANIVDLSTPVQQIKTDQAVLTSSNGTLSYSINGNNNNLTSRAQVTVPDGKNYHIRLSDGTEVYLNSATTFEFPFSLAPERRVRIHGEAYLKVAKDPYSPFIVELDNNVSVKVLGTAFNINTYDSLHPRIALIEGAVKISAGNDSTKLSPGFLAEYRPEKGLDVFPFDSNAVLGWRQGKYNFKGVSLTDLFNAVKRVYGVELSFDDLKHDQQQYFGPLNKQMPLEKFLDNLSGSHQITHYKEGNVIYIRANSK